MTVRYIRMAKRLTTFLPGAARRRFFKPRRASIPGVVTALDLDGSTLRVAQASNHTTLKLVATTQLEFSPQADRSDAQVVGTAVKQALAKLGVKASSVIMGVGRPRVVLRTLRLPCVENVAELASLVHFQVAKDLPFSAEEAVIDFQVVPRPPGEPEPGPQAPPSTVEAPPAEPGANAPRPTLDVLVAAVNREVVKFYQDLAAAAGFNLAALSLLSYANARCLAACELAGHTEVIALVTLRPEEVSVDVLTGSSLLFSRGTIMRAVGETPHIEGAVPVTEQAFVQAAAIEAVRSLHAYGGPEPNRPVAKVIVAGSTEHEAALVNELRPRLTAPCTQLESAEALRLPSELRGAAGGAIGPIGLAIGFGDEQGLPFDFLSPKRPAVQRDLRRIRILAGAAAVVVLVLAVLGVRKVLIDRRTNVLNAAAVELADAEKLTPMYRAMIRRAGVVNDWVKGGRAWLQHYAYLSSVLPSCDELYLTSLTVDHQGVIRLSVQARTGETLARLNQQLRSAGYEVRPYAINPGANRFDYVFRSSVELIPSPKLRIDLSKLKPIARPADDASLNPKAWRRGGR